MIEHDDVVAADTERNEPDRRLGRLPVMVTLTIAALCMVAMVSLLGGCSGGKNGDGYGAERGRPVAEPPSANPSKHEVAAKHVIAALGAAALPRNFRPAPLPEKTA